MAKRVRTNRTAPFILLGIFLAAIVLVLMTWRSRTPASNSITHLNPVPRVAAEPSPTPVIDFVKEIDTKWVYTKSAVCNVNVLAPIGNNDTKVYAIGETGDNSWFFAGDTRTKNTSPATSALDHSDEESLYWTYLLQDSQTGKSGGDVSMTCKKNSDHLTLAQYVDQFKAGPRFQNVKLEQSTENIGKITFTILHGTYPYYSYIHQYGDTYVYVTAQHLYTFNSSETSYGAGLGIVSAAKHIFSKIQFLDR